MSRFRVALSGDFRNPDGSPAYPMFDLRPLHAAGAGVAYVDPVERVMPAAGLSGFDALILLGARFEASSVPADGRLAVVARFGVGFDNVDTDACTRAGIALVTTPDGVRRPVAVAVVTFLLALAGRLVDKDRITRMGPAGWARRSDYMGVGLTGRTFAQLGMGNIGAEVCRLLRPFDMRLIAHDPYGDPALARDLGVTLVDLETLFREADFLSISVPLNDETRGIVDAGRLALMKPGAFLINTARGPIVDQQALVGALRERRIAGAGLDVFEEEPTPADEPLLRLDNVVLAPHALCWTDECFAGNGAVDVDAVLAIMRGEVPTRGLVVNRAVRDSPAWQAKLRRLSER
jgi:phosphoglycerate dehydrogenase-like enzyme